MIYFSYLYENLNSARFYPAKPDSLSRVRFTLLFAGLIILFILFSYLLPIPSLSQIHIYSTNYTHSLSRNFTFATHLPILSKLNNHFSIQLSIENNLFDTKNHHKIENNIDNNFLFPISIDVVLYARSHDSDYKRIFEVHNYKTQLICSNLLTRCYPLVVYQNFANEELVESKIIMSIFFPRNDLKIDKNTNTNILLFHQALKYEFSIFQLIIRYFFLIISCYTAIYILYFHLPIQVRTLTDFSQAQLVSWNIVLLLGLSLLNDPFFVFRLIFPSYITDSISIVSQTLFFAFFLFYVIFRTRQFFFQFQNIGSEVTIYHIEDLDNSENENHALAFQILICGLFFISSMFACFISLFAVYLNPLFGLDYENGTLILSLISLIFFIIIFFWFLFFSFKVWKEILFSEAKSISSLYHQQFLHLRRRFILFFLFTFILLIFIISVMISHFFYLSSAKSLYYPITTFLGNFSLTNSSVFLSFITLMNVFVYITAYMDSPSKYVEI